MKKIQLKKSENDLIIFSFLLKLKKRKSGINATNMNVGFIKKINTLKTNNSFRMSALFFINKYLNKMIVKKKSEK